jgi:hypothetical protein
VRNIMEEKEKMKTTITLERMLKEAQKEERES